MCTSAGPPLGKQVFFEVLLLSFIGAPKRLIGTPPGPRRGEEEERRRGGHISFARARYPEDGLAQSFARTHDANTEHNFPVAYLNLRKCVGIITRFYLLSKQNNYK